MLAGSGWAITRLRARGTIINTYLHQSHQRHMCVLIRDPPSADQTRDLTEPSLYHAHKRCSRSQLFAPARQLPKETRRLQRWRRCTHLSRRIMMTVHSRSTSRRQSPLSRSRRRGPRCHQFSSLPGTPWRCTPTDPRDKIIDEGKRPIFGAFLSTLSSLHQ